MGLRNCEYQPVLSTFYACDTAGLASCPGRMFPHALMIISTPGVSDERPEDDPHSRLHKGGGQSSAEIRSDVGVAGATGAEGGLRPVPPPPLPYKPGTREKRRARPSPGMRGPRVRDSTGLVSSDAPRCSKTSDSKASALSRSAFRCRRQQAIERVVNTEMQPIHGVAKRKTPSSTVKHINAQAHQLER